MQGLTPTMMESPNTFPSLDKAFLAWSLDWYWRCIQLPGDAICQWMINISFIFTGNCYWDHNLTFDVLSLCCFQINMDIQTFEYRTIRLFIFQYHKWVVLLLKNNSFIITVPSIHFREKNSLCVCVCVSHRVFQDISILSELQQDVRRWSWRKTNKHTNIHVLPLLTIRVKLLAKLLLPKYSDPGLVQLIIRWQRFTLTIERIHLSWRKAHLMHTCGQRQVEQASISY